MAQNDPDLMEWDSGPVKAKRASWIVEKRPGWYVFRDGCPSGETPEDVRKHRIEWWHVPAPSMGMCCCSLTDIFCRSFGDQLAGIADAGCPAPDADHNLAQHSGIRSHLERACAATLEP